MIETEVKENFKRNSIINFIGYGIYMGCQWLINILVVRLAGFSEAGILSLAISITSIFFVMAHFNVRNYQVSDSKNEFSDKEYILHRISSCFIALILCLVCSFTLGYRDVQLFCIVVYMFFKVTEAFLDVLHGILQKNWRLDWIGYSFAIRGIVSVLLFGSILAITQNLLIAVGMMCIGSFIILWIYEVKKVRNVMTITSKINFNNVVCLYKKSTWMFIYYFMFNLLTIFPRCILEAYYGSEVLGIFTSIAAPVFIVQLSATLILNPVVNLFTEYYEKKDKRKFQSVFFKSIGIIFFICLTLVVFSILLDDILLPLLFGNSIREYCYLFVPLMIATSFLVFSSLAFTVLTVIRELRTMVFCVLISFMVCIVSTMIWIPKYGLEAMNRVMIVTFLILDVISFVLIWKKVKKRF